MKNNIVAAYPWSRSESCVCAHSRLQEQVAQTCVVTAADLPSRRHWSAFDAYDRRAGDRRRTRFENLAIINSFFRELKQRSVALQGRQRSYFAEVPWQLQWWISTWRWRRRSLFVKHSVIQSRRFSKRSSRVMWAHPSSSQFKVQKFHSRLHTSPAAFDLFAGERSNVGQRFRRRKQHAASDANSQRNCGKHF